MNASSLLPLLSILALHNVSAQNDKVLSGSNITKAALIQALTPASGSQVDGPRTRGIRVVRENAGDMLASTPAKTASASLLITFQTNSAQLTPDAKQKLNVVGEALSSDQLNDYQFSIQGHADPRGNPLSNLKLSQRRAEAVREYLVDSAHIANQRLEAVGKGDKEPLNMVNPVAPENRRVTIVTLTQ